MHRAAVSSGAKAAGRFSWLSRRNASSASSVHVRHGEHWRPVALRTSSIGVTRDLHPCSGPVSGRWEGERWLPEEGSSCKPIEVPEDLESVFRCLNGKRIAFLGDSHLRNLFRCVADELTLGVAGDAVGWPAPALNNASQPISWPNYTHLDMHSPDRGIGGNPVTNEEHRLSCSNAAKIHRHDYSYSVQEGDTSIELAFLWNPWGGNAPLVQTPEVVAELGPEGASYRLNYTGGRARGPFLEALRAAQEIDLLVTGGEHRNHSALFHSFPSSAVLVDHAAVVDDELHSQAAAYDIPVADVSNALRSSLPLLQQPVVGLHGLPRVFHLPEDILRLQSRLFLTLAVDKVCGQRTAPPGQRVSRRVARRNW